MKTLTFVGPSMGEPWNGSALYVNENKERELIATGIDSIHAELFKEIVDAFNSRQAAREAARMLAD